MDKDILPKATFVVNSGTGLHLYYVLDEPVPMYPQNQLYMKELKYALTRQIWNRFTSTIKEPQMQGIMQGFRVIGTCTKLGEEFPVVAYSVGDRISLNELLTFIPDSNGEQQHVKSIMMKNRLSIEEAKEKYPDWYEKRIVRKERRGRWTIKRDLYDWWLNRIKTEIKVGHRFYGIMTLAIYAKKCCIEEGELMEWSAVKDLLVAGSDAAQSTAAKDLMRDVFYVPESMHCSELFKLLSQKKTVMATVVDEYGGTAGIVTMEDLVETIVGDIRDEYDNEEEDIKQISDDTYTISGNASPEDVFGELGLELPEDNDSDTMSGFVTSLLGHIPEENEHASVRYRNVLFTVLVTEDMWISKLKAEIIHDDISDGEDRDNENNENEKEKINEDEH